MAHARTRLTQFTYRGRHAYSLTLCTHNRRCVFVTDDVVDAVLSGIRHTAEDQGFAVCAYCFMPDHLHLLVEGLTPGSDLASFVARAKQATGYRYRARSRERLWQRSYYEHVLRSDEDVMAACRYVWANPVRAGLVTDAADYRYSGSDVYRFPELLEGTSFGE